MVSQIERNVPQGVLKELRMDEKDLKAIESLLEKQTTQFQRYLGIVEENSQHKLDLVVEGQQMLAERIDRMEERLDKGIDQVEKRVNLVEANLTRKLDAVAADLTEHRKDTEAHHGVYRVKEE